MLRFEMTEKPFNLAKDLKQFKKALPITLTKGTIMVPKTEEDDDVNNAISTILESGIVSNVFNYHEDAENVEDNKIVLPLSEELEEIPTALKIVDIPESESYTMQGQDIVTKKNNSYWGNVPKSQESQTQTKTIQYGHFYWADLPENDLHIDCGTRPVLVISSDRGNATSPKIHIIPISKKQRYLASTQLQFEWANDCYEVDLSSIKNLNVTCIAKCDGLTCIPKEFVKNYIGKASKELLRIIKQKTENVFGKWEEYHIVEACVVKPHENLPTALDEVFKKDINIDDFNVEGRGKNNELNTLSLMERVGFNMAARNIKVVQSAIIRLISEEYSNLDELTESLSTETSPKEDIERVLISQVREVKKTDQTPTINVLKTIAEIIRKGVSLND